MEKDQYIIAKGVVKEDGKFLMVKRDREWDDETHGTWEFPGGKVEFGEKPSRAACREVKEETGFSVEDPELVKHIYSHIWDYETRKSQVVILPFHCNLNGGSKDTSDKNVAEVSWLTAEEIREKECNPGTRELLEALHSS